MNYPRFQIAFLLLLALQLVACWIGFMPWWTLGFAGILFVAVTAYGASRVSSQFFIKARYKGVTASDAVALTFDDGPLPGYTERILTILKAHETQAAFFCIGSRVTSNPELVSRIHAEGHIIGNHTYSHAALFDLFGKSRMEHELHQTDRAVHAVLGLTPRFFRPPYGVTNPNLAEAVRRAGHTVVGWSVRSFDTMTHDGDQLYRRITGQLKGGDVILLHDYCDSTIQILPQLLDYIATKGLRVERLDHLINERPYV